MVRAVFLAPFCFFHKNMNILSNTNIIQILFKYYQETSKWVILTFVLFSSYLVKSLGKLLKYYFLLWSYNKLKTFYLYFYKICNHHLVSGDLGWGRGYHLPRHMWSRNVT